MSFVVWIVVILSFVVAYLYLRRPKNIPPGPPAIPLLGSVGFLRKLKNVPPYEGFMAASKQYGGLLGIWIGPKLMVILNGFDTINQAFVNQVDDFMDRPNTMAILDNALKHGKGIIWSNGKEWDVMRTFVIRTLDSFGSDSKMFEKKVLREFQAVAELIKNGDDIVHDASQLWKSVATNIILNITCSQRYDYQDSTLLRLRYNMDTTLGGSSFVSALNFLPKFLHPLARSALKEQQGRDAATDECFELITGFIEDHKNGFDPNNINDFIDAYLKVSAKDSGESKNEFFHAGNMFRVIYDFFISATNTVAFTMDWILLYLIENPHIQIECRKLIAEQVSCLPVKLEDKPNLQYIEAVIMECQRIGSVAPIGVPRTCMDHDISIQGYTIPKGTLVLPNLYSAHMDTKYWEQPNQFKPERFLDSEGDLVQPEAFIPNTIGPRKCIGEMFARNEIFLLVSNLLATFEFNRADELVKHDYSCDPAMKSARAPTTYDFKRVVI